jgi:anti-anti-sigma regulatory factor
VIFDVLKEVRGRGWLGVVSPNPNVRRLLQLAGLLGEESFVVFMDEDEAAEFISVQRLDDFSRFYD